jgi:hypothetical protein
MVRNALFCLLNKEHASELVVPLMSLGLEAISKQGQPTYHQTESPEASR